MSVIDEYMSGCSVDAPVDIHVHGNIASLHISSNHDNHNEYRSAVQVYKEHPNSSCIYLRLDKNNDDDFISTGLTVAQAEELSIKLAYMVAYMKQEAAK